MVSRFGLQHHLELEDNQEYSFDLTNQITLHIGADGGGILGDTVGDAGTIRTNCSTQTLGTTKDYLNPPINNLLVLEYNASTMFNCLVGDWGRILLLWIFAFEIIILKFTYK